MIPKMTDRISELHADICKTLGSPARIEILNLLQEREKTVGELAGALGLKQANVSQHLAVLRQRHVVATRKEGTSIYYRVPNLKIIQACRLMREVLIDQLKETRKLAAIATEVRAR